jgi:acetyl-CoA C-acetyltransferase
MGCVQPGRRAGRQRRAQRVLASKLPEACRHERRSAVRLSQQALHFAAQAVMSGRMDVVIAAGVESMSRVPMGLSIAAAAKNGFGTPKSPK